MEWTLEPKATITRVDLHKNYGGSRQGGISPSAQTPNVFIFSDASVGEQYGYFDRWLFPARPRKDLEALLLSQGIHAVWQAAEGNFEDNRSGEFS
jgi:hypothetical protein